MKTKLPLLITAILTAMLAFGCGGDDQQTGTAGDQAAATTSQSQSTADADSSASAREVVIEANDQMQFDIENFDVQPGERIRVVLKNVGTMPKFSMGHNFVLLEQATDAAAFVEEAMNAADNDYLPPEREEAIIAHTELLGGGEEDSVTFTAPQEPGEYVFVCSFPGHYQIGMYGTMTVQ